MEGFLYTFEKFKYDMDWYLVLCLHDSRDIED